MGSGSLEDDETQVARPSISFSRCRPTKRKLRTEGGTATKSSLKPKPSSRKRRSSDSKNAPLSNLREYDKRLEELEKSFLCEMERPLTKRVQTKVGARPPIPSFHWSGSDDEDEVLLPVTLSTKKEAKTQILQLPKSTAPDAAPLSSSQQTRVPSSRDDQGESTADLKQTTIKPQPGSGEEQKKEAQRSSSETPSIATAGTKAMDATDSQKSQPSQRALNQAIDHIYQAADLNTTTRRLVVQSLEQQFQVSLPSKTKKQVRKRLSNLINGRLAPAPKQNPRQRCTKPDGSEAVSVSTSTSIQHIESQSTRQLSAGPIKSVAKQNPIPIDRKNDNRYPSEIREPNVDTQAINEAHQSYRRDYNQASVIPPSLLRCNALHAAVLSPASNATGAHQQHNRESLKPDDYQKYDERYSGRIQALKDGNLPTNIAAESCQSNRNHENNNENVPPLPSGAVITSTVPSSTGILTAAPSCIVSTSAIPVAGAPRERKQESPRPSDKKKPAGFMQGKVIALDADSDDDSIGCSLLQLKPKVHSLEQELAKENNGAAATQSNASKPTKAGGKTNRKQRATKGKTANASKKAAQKGTRKRGGDCHKCKTCACKNSPKDPGFSLLHSSYNPVDREKSLLGQIKALEKATESKETELATAWRELKKVRRTVWRDREEKARVGYLPEGKEMESQMDQVEIIAIPEAEVTKSRVRLFGTKENTYQPTLTQMFGGEGRNKNAEEEKDSKGETATCTRGNAGMVESKESTSDEEDGEESDGGNIGDYLDDDSNQDDDAVDQDVVCHRTRWRNGSVCPSSNSPKQKAGTIWNALLTAGLQREQEGGYDCAFNRLFANERTDIEPDLGMDHLIELFGDSSAETSPVKRVPTTPLASKGSPEVGLSTLTQRGKSLAERIQDQVTSDASQLADLEVVCPQWRENVAYAMHQKETTDLQAALGNIQQSKARLEAMKDCFLRAWQQQQSALGVYELALNQSLSRLETHMSSVSPAPGEENVALSPATSRSSP